MDILNENGKSEEFDSSKVEVSIRNVGRDEQTANEIRLHNGDMQNIGASDGWDIIAQRNLL